MSSSPDTIAPPVADLADDAFSLQDSKSSGKKRELDAWHQITAALSTLDPAAQARVLRSVITILDITIWPSQAIGRTDRSTAPSSPSSSERSAFSGSEARAPSPKEFLYEKRPLTDVDKIACLAYYLTHYRNTPHFKTFDLSQLNTEAAQIKFSNPAQAVDNATKAGLLVPAVKGQKQISAVGELYVQALPDRTAARAAIEGSRRRRKRAAATARKSEV
jgi:hypothetical protein